MSKIFIISSEFPPGPGGIGQHAFSMAFAMNKPVLVLANQDYADSEVCDAFNASLPSHIQFIRFAKRSSFFTSLARIYQVFKLVQKHNPESVIVTGRFSLWVGGLLKISSAKTHVLGIVHGTEISIEGGILARVTAFFYLKLDGIVAVSQFTNSLLHSGVLSHRVRIVPNGIDAALLDESSITQNVQRLTGQPALLTVGNLTPRKGQHRVIKAMSMLLQKFPDLRYHMVGLPTKGKALSDLSTQLGVKHAVVQHGRLSRQDLYKFYRGADVFIMLSENQTDGDVEGFGIAILEANAFGLPAIGAKGCGIEEAISPHSGILVDGDNPEEIMMALESIMANYKLYSKGARAWAEKHNWQVLVKLILELTPSQGEIHEA